MEAVERVNRTAMRTLHQAVQAHGKEQAPALLKYLNESGIQDWGDLTKIGLNDFKDIVTERVAASSAKTYFAVFKAILRRYEDDVEFCKDYASILKASGKKPLKTCCGSGYGNYVAIDHGTFKGANYKAYYAHMGSVTVSNGTYVKKGQIIGYLGSTGRSTGPHLHFGVMKNNAWVNPMSYF